MAIDLLRFAAAAMVMLYHYFGEWSLVTQAGVGDPSGPSGLPSNDWLRAGWVGVEIFFVISGYVISLSATNSTAIDFARRRLLRLWPGTLVCATLTALVLLAAGLSWEFVAPRYAASAMMWLWEDQIDVVYWSLLVECVFYALVTFLLAIGRWHPARVGLALSFCTLAYMAWTISIGYGAAENGRLSQLAPFAAFFGLGILIQQSHQQPGSVKGWMFLPSLIAAPVCIAGINGADGGGATEEALLLFGIGVSVIVLAKRLQDSVRSERLRRWAVALGLATYPLYLIHAYIGQALLVGAARLGISPIVAVGPVILLMIMVALFIAMRVEPVVRTRIDQLLSPILRPSLRPAA